MKANRDDVRAMVAALFATNAALDRARRQKKGARTLSLLQIVAASPGIRPTEIANAQDVHPSQVTRQARDLESDGLLRIAADPADRRSCRVTLTSSGVKEWKRLTDEGLDRFAAFVADWEPEEVQTLTLLLEKLEASKAAVAAQQRPPAGRRWATRPLTDPNHRRHATDITTNAHAARTTRPSANVIDGIALRATTCSRVL